MEQLPFGGYPETTPDQPRPSRGPRRAAVAAAACVVVAGGAIAVAGTTGGTPAAATSAAAAAAPTTTVPKGAPQPWPGGRRRGRGSGGGFGFGGGGEGGKIASISAGGFTVSAPGATYTFTTSSATVYLEGGVPVSRSAMAVGDSVAVRAAAPASSTATSLPASAVELLMPEIAGKVVSISGSGMVIQDREGFWRTIDVSSSTVYAEAGKTTSASSVKTGSYVVASGQIAGDHTTLDASAVALLGSMPGGPGLPGGTGAGFFGPAAGGPWPGGGPPPFGPGASSGVASSSATD
jgi:hypothetical protein